MKKKYMKNMRDEPDKMRVEAGELVRALKVVDQLSGGHGGDAQQ